MHEKLLMGAWAMAIGGIVILVGCADHAGLGEVESGSASLTIDTEGPTTVNTPIGLALEVENGVGAPVQVRAGQRFFVDQIDLRTFVETSDDNPNLDQLREEGDFACLDWRGLEQVENEPVLLPNADGSFTDRRFYRGARWMERRSHIAVWQVDASGHRVGRAVWIAIGRDNRRRRFDQFFIRRLRGIQFANDCAAPDDCSSATSFMEEALVELRNANRRAQTFRIRPETVGLRMWWTARWGAPYEIPVEQVETPEFDYNFAIDLEAITEPGPEGYYEPGSEVTFRFTMRDGAGNRLHPEGSIPSYADVAFGIDPTGIQYYRAFFDPAATYWRRKHRERGMGIMIIGPNQDIQPIRTIAPLEAFLGPDSTIPVGLPERDGVYSEAATIPASSVVFGGAFVPGNTPWFEPQPDTVSFQLPENVEPGTYRVAIKGRRTYLGQDIPHTTVVQIQVGTSTHTYATETTGPCTTCHSDGGDLSLVLHGNDDRAACAGCHVPLGFELEGPVYVRTHFIHSRSDRFDAPLQECANCHISEESIQRTSQSACLSCHTSYPASHIEAYGPIESIYTGGLDQEAFTQCTESCHVEHPGSGFGGGH
ncbi:MAG: cytochrome C [Sandaracinaceae bacterium]